MGRLEGQTAIVTGAAQGMGMAHARALVREGARTIFTDVNEGPCRELAEELGPNALFIAQDVRKEADWQRVLEEGERRFGPVSVLVNNAGIIGPVQDLVELSEADFLNVCAVNQLGVFFGMKTVIPSMARAGGGSIVNISSIAGMVGLAASPNPAYVASKFAVRGMTKFAAVKYGPQNIRINSIHPGYINTPMMKEATDEEGGGAAAVIPLRRFAEPEEVSALVVFLASNESSFISGVEHVIDGAMLAG